ncbi:SE-domain-containing protein [Patellaria atrata CBS 101060]|uniref:Squalene monooxygenase n=1 Tax=Patellaria atrata CBS 101060 TaxID=1346257 RepID=A0A9P4S5H1_9PEZI|nr:SE-domain-containing protein [Patellaria atrata CBS 101060]
MALFPPTLLDYHSPTTMTAIETEYDIIIICAGVAGSAAAESDRIFGELLQPGGVVALEELGMSNCLEDIDCIPVRGYHIYWKNDEVTFWYPPKSIPNSTVPNCADRRPKTRRPEGRSFHHGRFASKLREEVRSQKNVKVIESTALSARIYYPNLTIIANGYSSDFRCHRKELKPQLTSRFWGLELIDVSLPEPGLAYGVIGRGPPALIYDIGSYETRSSSIVESDTKSYIEETVTPTLHKAVQSSWLPPKSRKAGGALLLGDAGNMRHPLNGGGMTVALKDVLHWRCKSYSASLNILTQALYALFEAENPQLEIMQRGFPAGLMGGVIHSPLVLFYHFFSIAIHSMGLLIYESPMWFLPVTIVRCILVFSKTLGTILPFILSEVWS